MYIWEDYASDLYVLAKDILENLYHQREGYKGWFYYSFSPDLKFQTCGSSGVDQFKLLEKLADKGMLDFKEEAVPSDLPRDFLSRNMLKNHTVTPIKITIKPDEFNKQLRY